jgi:hypothetical protein
VQLIELGVGNGGRINVGYPASFAIQSTQSINKTGIVAAPIMQT